MEEKKISREVIFKGKVFTVFRDVVSLPDGQKAQREIIEHHGGVCIYAEIDDDVLMVQQFRYAHGREFLEFPAGKLESGEQPEKAAIRELQEETGYQAATMTSLGSFVPTCGYSSEVIYLFKASDLTFVGQHLDPTEFLKVKRIKKRELRALIEDDTIEDGKTIALAFKVGI